MIPIKYIGKRERYTEGCYGSKIEFVQGETVSVPDDLAVKLLRHPDQYERGEEAEKEAIIQPKEDEEDTQDDRDAVANMDRDALIEFASTRFNGYKLDKRRSDETLRDEVIRLIDQYGLT